MDLGLGEAFLDLTSKTGSIKGNPDLIEMEDLGSVKDSIQRIKRWAPEWKNILANHRSDTGLATRICKELSTLNSKKQTIQSENGQKTWMETCYVFREEASQIANKHMRRCATSLAIREI